MKRLVLLLALGSVCEGQVSNQVAAQPRNIGRDPEYKRVCYYTNWSQYRKQPGRFFPFNIDPFLCTHLIFAFSKVDYNGHLAPYEWNDIQYPHLYRQFTGLKKKNPHLRTLLAVGGWTHGSRPFTDMVKTKIGRQSFIDHAIQYLRTHNFDGLDLDWEYPANRGSPKEDKKMFSTLVMELKNAFEDEASRTGKECLLLAAAVAAGIKISESAYEVPIINKYLDFINLMSYDLHGSWSKSLGINAPLYPDPNIEDPKGADSVDEVVKHWLRLGATRDKLVMGIAMYGRSFTLCSEKLINLGDKNCGPGKPAKFTREKGFISYYEMKDRLKKGWTRVWSDSQMVPYAYSLKEKQWVGYDDIQSVKIKAQYIKQNKLAGAMLWSIDLDDFANIASKGEVYPLSRAIRSVLEDTEYPPFKPPPKISPNKKRLRFKPKSTILNDASVNSGKPSKSRSPFAPPRSPFSPPKSFKKKPVSNSYLPRAGSSDLKVEGTENHHSKPAAVQPDGPVLGTLATPKYYTKSTKSWRDSTMVISTDTNSSFRQTSTSNYKNSSKALPHERITPTGKNSRSKSASKYVVKPSSERLPYGSTQDISTGKDVRKKRPISTASNIQSSSGENKYLKSKSASKYVIKPSSERMPYGSKQGIATGKNARKNIPISTASNIQSSSGETTSRSKSKYDTKSSSERLPYGSEIIKSTSKILRKPGRISTASNIQSSSLKSGSEVKEKRTIASEVFFVTDKQVNKDRRYLVRTTPFNPSNKKYPKSPFTPPDTVRQLGNQENNAVRATKPDMKYKGQHTTVSLNVPKVEGLDSSSVELKSADKRLPSLDLKHHSGLRESALKRNNVKGLKTTSPYSEESKKILESPHKAGDHIGGRSQSTEDNVKKGSKIETSENDIPQSNESWKSLSFDANSKNTRLSSMALKKKIKSNLDGAGVKTNKNPYTKPSLHLDVTQAGVSVIKPTDAARERLEKKPLKPSQLTYHVVTSQRSYHVTSPFKPWTRRSIITPRLEITDSPKHYDASVGSKSVTSPRTKQDDVSVDNKSVTSPYKPWTQRPIVTPRVYVTRSPKQDGVSPVYKTVTSPYKTDVMPSKHVTDSSKQDGVSPIYKSVTSPYKPWTRRYAVASGTNVITDSVKQGEKTFYKSATSPYKPWRTTLHRKYISPTERSTMSSRKSVVKKERKPIVDVYGIRSNNDTKSKKSKSTMPLTELSSLRTTTASYYEKVTQVSNILVTTSSGMHGASTEDVPGSTRTFFLFAKNKTYPTQKAAYKKATRKGSRRSTQKYTSTTESVTGTTQNTKDRVTHSNQKMDSSTKLRHRISTSQTKNERHRITTSQRPMRHRNTTPQKPIRHRTSTSQRKYSENPSTSISTTPSVPRIPRTYPRLTTQVRAKYRPTTTQRYVRVNTRVPVKYTTRKPRTSTRMTRQLDASTARETRRYVKPTTAKSTTHSSRAGLKSGNLQPSSSVNQVTRIPNIKTTAGRKSRTKAEVKYRQIKRTTLPPSKRTHPLKEPRTTTKKDYHALKLATTPQPKRSHHPLKSPTVVPSKTFRTIRPTELPKRKLKSTTIKPTKRTYRPIKSTTIKPTKKTNRPVKYTTTDPTKRTFRPTKSSTINPTKRTLRPIKSTTTDPTKRTYRPITSKATEPLKKSKENHKTDKPKTFTTVSATAKSSKFPPTVIVKESRDAGWTARSLDADSMMVITSKPTPSQGTKTYWVRTRPTGPQRIFAWMTQHTTIHTSTNGTGFQIGARPIITTKPTTITTRPGHPKHTLWPMEAILGDDYIHVLKSALFGINLTKRPASKTRKYHTVTGAPHSGSKTYQKVTKVNPKRKYHTVTAAPESRNKKPNKVTTVSDSASNTYQKVNKIQISGRKKHSRVTKVPDSRKRQYHTVTAAPERRNKQYNKVTTVPDSASNTYQKVNKIQNSRSNTYQNVNKIQNSRSKKHSRVNKVPDGGKIKYHTVTTVETPTWWNLDWLHMITSKPTYKPLLRTNVPDVLGPVRRTFRPIGKTRTKATPGYKGKTSQIPSHKKQTDKPVYWKKSIFTPAYRKPTSRTTYHPGSRNGKMGETGQDLVKQDSHQNGINNWKIGANGDPDRSLQNRQNEPDTIPDSHKYEIEDHDGRALTAEADDIPAERMVSTTIAPECITIGKDEEYDYAIDDLVDYPLYDEYGDYYDSAKQVDYPDHRQIVNNDYPNPIITNDYPNPLLKKDIYDENAKDGHEKKVKLTNNDYFYQDVRPVHYQSGDYVIAGDTSKTSSMIGQDNFPDSQGSRQSDINGFVVPEFICPSVFGIFPDPHDCRQFYQCVWFVPFHHMCGVGTVWNQQMKICDWPGAVTCFT